MLKVLGRAQDTRKMLIKVLGHVQGTEKFLRGHLKVLKVLGHG